MTDKEFINQFKKISLKTICTEENINYHNIVCGRAGYNSTKKIAKKLANEMCDLLNKREEFMAVDFDTSIKNAK